MGQHEAVFREATGSALHQSFIENGTFEVEFMGIYHSRPLTFMGAGGNGTTVQLETGHPFPTWFRSLPPERIGLQGEYDYYGLQKRVEAAFQERYHSELLDDLHVHQRGRVIVLHGRVANRAMLRQLIHIAEATEGIIRVEATWVTCDEEARVMAAG